MNFTTPFVFSAAAALALAGPALAVQTETDAQARLDELIQSRPAEATAPDREEVLRSTIKTLLETNRAKQIIPLGESAGSVLRELTEAASLAELIGNPRGGAHGVLIRTAPRAAVDYFHDLQTRDPERFETLLRSDFQFGPLVDAELRESGRLSPEAVQQLILVIERTLAHKPTPIGLRVNTAVLAYTNQFDSAAIHAFLREHLELAFQGAGPDDLERIVPVVIAPGAALPDRIPHEVLWQLLRSTDPLITTDVFVDLVERATGVTGEAEPLESDFLVFVEERWTRDSEFSPAKVERVVRALGKSPSSVFEQHWGRRNPMIFPTASHALAAWRGAGAGSEQLQKGFRANVLRWIKRLEGFSEERASITLDLLLESNSTAAADSILSALTFTKGAPEDKLWKERVHIHRVLGAVPAARVPAAVDWLTKTQSQLTEHADRNASKWTHASAELRGLMGRSGTGQAAWYLCAKALLGMGQSTAQDRAEIIERIAADAARPESRAAAAGFFENLTWSSANDSPLHWMEVSTTLLGMDSVPDEVVTEVPFPLREIDGEAVRRIAVRFLNAADARQRQAGGTLTFRNVDYYALRAAQADPTLIRTSLLGAWLEQPSISRELITVIGDCRDEALIARARERVIAEVQKATFLPHKLQKADWMLLLPGEESVRMLVELALKSENAELVDHVDQRVKRFLSLRRAAAEWSTLASGGDSIDEAKLKVIALLDSPHKAVRVEAIYGLGTLGAIETLPRLIPLVASEDAEIREAARATLKHLRTSQTSAGAQQSESQTEAPKD